MSDVCSGDKMSVIPIRFPTQVLTDPVGNIPSVLGLVEIRCIGAATYTLPSLGPSSNPIMYGMILHLRNTGTDPLVLLASPGDTIDTNPSLVVPVNSVQTLEVYTDRTWQRGGGSALTYVNNSPMGISNVVIVSKNPGPGEFDSIADANDSIVGNTVSNRYVILVAPGTYTDRQIALKAYVYVVGYSTEAVRVSPNGNFDLFYISQPSGISGLTIFGMPTTYRAINVQDAGDYVSCSNLVIEGGLKGVACSSLTRNTFFNLVNTSFKNVTQSCVVADASSGFICQVALTHVEQVGHCDIAVAQIGISSSVYADDVFFRGDDTSIAFLVNDGEFSGRNMYIEHWAEAIKVDIAATSAVVSLAGILFEAISTWNLNIASPNVTGEFVGYSEYDLTYINPLSAFFVAGVNRNIVTVAQKGANFTSIAAAIAAITDASISNIYVISVGPGRYTEGTLTLKQYIRIVGYYASTIIVPSNPANPIIVGAPNAGIYDLVLSGAATCIQYLGSATVGLFNIRGIRCANTTTFANFNASAGAINVVINDLYIFGGPSIQYVIRVNGTSNPASVVVNNATTNNVLLSGLISMFEVTGPNALAVFSSIEVHSSVAISPGDAMTISNGADVDIFNTLLSGFTRGVYVPNVGAGPDLFINAAMRNDTMDYVILNPATFGTVTGIADYTKMNVQSSVLGINVNGAGGSLALSGQIYQGTQFARLTNITEAIQFSVVGVTTGGDLSHVGLTVSVTAGTGYLKIDAGGGDAYLKYVTWASQNVAMSANSFAYFYIDNAGVLQQSGSQSDDFTTIQLGTAITNSTDITALLLTKREGDYTPARVDNNLRRAIGPIFVSGCLATPNVAAFKVDVGSGDYWYSTHQYTPTAGTAISWSAFYQNGVGGWTQVTQSAVTLHYDNGSGTLAAIPVGKWVKNALYISGGPAHQHYLFVYGQTLFDLELDAQVGVLPTPPSSFVQSIAPIAGIITTQGDVGLSSNRFRDIRPTLSFQSQGVTASANHNALLNLAVGDAHPQYFRTDGTRVMAGDIDVGTNDIINLGTANGVVVEAHASRHVPGGADPLPVGVPSTIGTSNSQGVLPAFARQDHIHAHGAQTDATLHAAVTGLANGFMVSADKIKLDAATASNTANTIMLRDGSRAVGVSTLQVFNGANKVSLQANPALAADYSLQMPINAGTVGQVLTTDGTGVTSWAAAGTGFPDPMTTRGDMIYRNSVNATARLPLGTQSQFLRAWDNDVTWQDRVVPLRESYFYDDFLNFPGDTNWANTVNGAGSVIGAVNPTVGNYTGVVTLTQAATGFTNIRKATSMRFGLGVFTSEIAIILPVLSAATVDYTVRIGYGDNTTNGDHNNGVYWQYDRAVSGNVWILKTATAGVRSTTVTASAIVANTWYRLGINVNAAGTLATFLLNGVNIGTIATNIPTTIGNQCGPNVQIARVSGSNTNRVTVDYWTHNYIMSNRF